LALLNDVAQQHPLLRGRVLSALEPIAGLAAGSDLEALVGLEVKRRAVDMLVALLRLGYALPSMRAMLRWQQGEAFDQSLIRRFLDNTLQSIKPAYSLDFLEAFCALCRDERTQQGVRASQATLSAVQSFVNKCIADEWNALEPTPKAALPSLQQLQTLLSTQAKARKRTWSSTT
jgi:hypothetical protein